ncbi:MAG: hypothetical protein E4H01_01895 [Lysobacterales bacterium]|nr:MAG: hypothetical protein E4H01_01895 [Xanthomonadales bacterium]
MKLPQGNPLYGPHIMFDTDPDSGGAGASAGNSDQTNWKEKYESLNGQIANGQYVTKDAYVALQKNLETAVGEKKQSAMDLGNATAKLALLQDQETTLTAKLTDAEKLKADLEGTVASKDKVIERHQTIFKEFPDLAPFEADKLLPQVGPDDDMKEVFNNFRTRIGELTSAKKADAEAGSTSEPKGNGQDGIPTGSTQLLQRAQLLSVQGKVAEYDQAMDGYYAALKTEGK